MFLAVGVGYLHDSCVVSWFLELLLHGSVMTANKKVKA